ncbi:hypothetical protein MINTM005_17030 [Mycobacterium intracellulare]|nr:hypothetical protein MINTM005_17030 [Mycobacterium intracellulare]BCO93600.1 hypothetical protein MINTM016_15760 [Mycobacterium intracellulare]
MSPPKRERPAPKDRPTRSDTNATDLTNITRQLRARRAASRRLPVLECGRSDPWFYKPPTAGYEDAAAHLLEHGLLPAANWEGLQAMWRSGGRSQQAAVFIARAWELVA